MTSNIDDSVITCHEIINAADGVSTNVINMTNTISTNVTNTMSINSDDKKNKIKNILRTVLLLKQWIIMILKRICVKILILILFW